MQILADQPELLHNTQTIIGVLLTIVVLCLFNNESNFLLQLIKDLTADFTTNLEKTNNKIGNEINEYIENLEKQKNIKAPRLYWVRLAKDNNLTNEYNELMQNNKEEQNINYCVLEALKKNKDILFSYKKEQRKQNERSKQNEQNFISLYFLIMLLFVMSLDACCISLEFGGVFLVMESIVSTYFSISLWRRWYKFDREANNTNYYNKNLKQILCDIIPKAILFILLLITILSSSNLQEWIGEITITATTMSLFFFLSQPLMHGLRYTEKHNNQPIKHPLYTIVFFIIIPSVSFIIIFIAKILSFSNTQTWIDLGINIATIVSFFLFLSQPLKHGFKYSEKYNNQPIKHSLYIIVFCFIIPCLLLFLIATSLSFSNTQAWTCWITTIVVTIFFIFSISQPLIHGFMYTERYNNQFIIKHAFYIIVLCILISFSFYGAIHTLDKIEILLSEGIWKDAIINLHGNIKAMTNNISWVRSYFIIISVGNIFFIPLLTGYYYNYKNAIKVSKSLVQIKPKIVNDLKENNNKYIEIVKKIEKLTEQQHN